MRSLVLAAVYSCLILSICLLEILVVEVRYDYAGNSTPKKLLLYYYYYYYYYYHYYHYLYTKI